MEEITSTAAVAAPVIEGASVKKRPWTVFASGPFRNLWAGNALSYFGDFFSYVAMAWLVLQLTGSSLALGSVLVAQALPRGILMIVGGATADRLSQRLTMLGSMGLRALAVAPLAFLVITGHVQLWQVYVLAAVFGVVDAFFYPARSSILPKIVDERLLEPGNAVLNVTAQVSVILGPVIGGLIVAGWGIGWAFAGDAACFVAGFLFILGLPRPHAAPSRGGHPDGGMGGQILAGLRYAWSDIGIRVLLIVIFVVDFAANGAIGVGLPTIAHARFGAGAPGFGIVLGAWGIGATAGALGAGLVPPPKRMGYLVVFVCLWLGVGLAVVGSVPSLAPAAVVMALSGVGSGAVNTYGISWLQRRTDPAMQGRVMSLVMLASIGLTPVSYVLSGAIAQANATLMFLIAGGMMVACGLVAASSRAVRTLT